MDTGPAPIADVLQKQLGNFLNTSPSDEDEARWAREREEAEERQQQDSIHAHLERSGVPRRHFGFIPPKSGPWFDAYARLKDQLGTGFLIVILGNRGTGKTQLGTCLIGRSCYNQRSARYVKAIDVFISLREAFRKEGLTEAQVVKQYVEPSLLVIDAMEERGETTFEDRMLNHIIDKRYDNMADTLLVSNQTPETFGASAGASIVSRIHETGEKIVCDWESFRSRA